jgi:predicted amidophosphoribosyltransferase
MYCMKCGAQLPADAAFCFRCGTPQTSVSSPPPQPPPPPRAAYKAAWSEPLLLALAMMRRVQMPEGRDEEA